MALDPKNIDEDETIEIVPGHTFVSYKYLGDGPSGLPISPTVSKNREG